MWRDMERVCDGLNIPLRKPTAFPRNGLLAARVVCAHSEEAWVCNFHLPGLAGLVPARLAAYSLMRVS